MKKNLYLVLTLAIMHGNLAAADSDGLAKSADDVVVDHSQGDGSSVASKAVEVHVKEDVKPVAPAAAAASVGSVAAQVKALDLVKDAGDKVIQAAQDSIKKIFPAGHGFKPGRPGMMSPAFKKIDERDWESTLRAELRNVSVSGVRLSLPQATYNQAFNAKKKLQDLVMSVCDRIEVATDEKTLQDAQNNSSALKSIGMLQTIIKNNGLMFVFDEFMRMRMVKVALQAFKNKEDAIRVAAIDLFTTFVKNFNFGMEVALSEIFTSATTTVEFFDKQITAVRDARLRLLIELATKGLAFEQAYALGKIAIEESTVLTNKRDLMTRYLGLTLLELVVRKEKNLERLREFEDLAKKAVGLPRNKTVNAGIKRLQQTVARVMVSVKKAAASSAS